MQTGSDIQINKDITIIKLIKIAQDLNVDRIIESKI